VDVAATDVVEVDVEDRPDAQPAQVGPGGVHVVDLEDRHVAAAPAVPIQVTSGRRAATGGQRCHDLQEGVADRHDAVAQPEPVDGRIVERCAQPQLTCPCGDDRVPVPRRNHRLPQPKCLHACP
jgi:hypothetical protein